MLGWGRVKCIPPSKLPPPAKNQVLNEMKSQVSMQLFRTAKYDLSNLGIGDKLYSKELDINAEVLECRAMLGNLHYRIKFFKHNVNYEKIISPAGLQVSGFSILQKPE